MTTHEIKGELKEFKGKLKQAFAELTDDDLAFLDGKREELVGALEKKTGQSRESLREKIKSINL